MILLSLRIICLHIRESISQKSISFHFIWGRIILDTCWFLAFLMLCLQRETKNFTAASKRPYYQILILNCISSQTLICCCYCCDCIQVVIQFERNIQLNWYHKIILGIFVSAQVLDSKASNLIFLQKWKTQFPLMNSSSANSHQE